MKNEQQKQKARAFNNLSLINIETYVLAVYGLPTHKKGKGLLMPFSQIKASVHLKKNQQLK